MIGVFCVALQRYMILLVRSDNLPGSFFSSRGSREEGKEQIPSPSRHARNVKKARAAMPGAMTRREE